MSKINFFFLFLSYHISSGIGPSFFSAKTIKNLDLSYNWDCIGTVQLVL